MTDGNEEYTISDYVSQNFAITIGETWTCLTCKTPKSSKIFKDLSFTLPLKKFQRKEKKEKNQSQEKYSFGEELCDNDIFNGKILWNKLVE